MWHRRLGTIWWKKTHLQIQIEKSSTNGSDFPLESRICCQKQNLWWQNVAKSLRHPGIQSFPWPEVAWRRGHTQPNDGHQGVPSRCPQVLVPSCTISTVPYPPEVLGHVALAAKHLPWTLTTPNGLQRVLHSVWPRGLLSNQQRIGRIKCETKSITQVRQQRATESTSSNGDGASGKPTKSDSSWI